MNTCVWLQVLTLPTSMAGQRDHKGRDHNTIRRITLYRQPQETSNEATMGLFRNLAAATLKQNQLRSSSSTASAAGNAAVAEGSPRARPLMLYQSASLTRASMPMTPFIRGGALPFFWTLESWLRLICAAAVYFCCTMVKMSSFHAFSVCILGRRACAPAEGLQLCTCALQVTSSDLACMCRWPRPAHDNASSAARRGQHAAQLARGGHSSPRNF